MDYESKVVHRQSSLFIIAQSVFFFLFSGLEKDPYFRHLKNRQRSITSAANNSDQSEFASNTTFRSLTTLTPFRKTLRSLSVLRSPILIRLAVPFVERYIPRDKVNGVQRTTCTNMRGAGNSAIQYRNTSFRDSAAIKSRIVLLHSGPLR